MIRFDHRDESGRLVLAEHTTAFGVLLSVSVQPLGPDDGDVTLTPDVVLELRDALDDWLKERGR